MAQLQTDFSEYPVGAGPSDWTFEVNINPSIVAGNYLRLNPSERWQSCSWNLVGSTSGITEVVAKLRSDSGFGFRMGAGPILNNAGGIFNLYLASLGQNIERQITINTSTELAVANFTDFRNIFVFNRFRVDESGNFSAWFWNDGDPPKYNTDPPDLSATDVTYTNGTSGIGIDSNNLGITILDVAFYGIGTNGDSALISIDEEGGSDLSFMIDSMIWPLISPM